MAPSALPCPAAGQRQPASLWPSHCGSGLRVCRPARDVLLGLSWGSLARRLYGVRTGLSSRDVESGAWVRPPFFSPRPVQPSSSEGRTHFETGGGSFGPGHASMQLHVLCCTGAQRCRERTFRFGRNRGSQSQGFPLIESLGCRALSRRPGSHSPSGAVEGRGWAVTPLPFGQRALMGPGGGGRKVE